MEAQDTLRAQYGAKQLNTVDTDIDIRFHSFIAADFAKLNAIYVVRDGVEVNVLTEITDDIAAEFMSGVVFRCFQGDIFTKVNISAGPITVYYEPNA